MSEYKKLRDKFDKDVKELQENCPHEELSELMEVLWGYGRTCGYRSKFCLCCNKQMYKPDLPKLEHETFDKIRELLKEDGTKIMSKNIKNVETKRCPICPEKYVLVYDDYLKAWFCGACSNMFPKVK